MQSFDRYAPQIRFQALGEAGQRKLAEARVLLVGCGALGSMQANLLVRAGVGWMRIVDRDFVELHNLHRQILFDEADVAADLPKAEAAARKLRRINSGVHVEAAVADFEPANAEELCRGAHLILDGTDNVETRFLINDLAVKYGLPWIYGACVGAEARVLPIIPHETPCLRCLWDEPPPPGVLPTCDTAGVLGPAATIVGSFQALAALQILAGRTNELNRKMLVADAWSGRIRQVDVQAAFDRGDCPCCKHGKYAYLAGAGHTGAVTLCGRDAVQVSPAGKVRLDLAAIAARLGPKLAARCNEFLLRFTVPGHEITVFPDGRAIVKGTSDPAAARSLYARYVG
jgi:molybdopterin-synthase adenylyltransferase